jgi:hypothetical protein
MRHHAAIITTFVLGIIVGSVAEAATNDFPSAVLALPKSDSTFRLDSSLLPSVGRTSPPAVVLQGTATTNYSMQILKPSQGTNYCLRVVKPAEGTNYVIQIFR